LGATSRVMFAVIGLGGATAWFCPLTETVEFVKKSLIES